MTVDIRHDWSSREVAALFALPFPELLFRAQTLHHKYFEVNYGGDGAVPLDKWFGTLHDGSDAAQEAMNQRFLARRKAQELARAGKSR